MPFSMFTIDVVSIILHKKCEGEFHFVSYQGRNAGE